MHFDNIAKFVHRLAENSDHNSAIIEQLKSSSKIGNCELDAITKVFSKEELSGDCLAIGVSPTLFWF
jgi:hypothetical protein